MLAEIWWALLILLLAMIGLIWIIKEMRSFYREDRAYKERQAARVAIIERGLQDAERDGVEVIPFPPFDKIKE